MNAHRYAISAGCDIPDLSPLLRPRALTLAYRVVLETGSTWKVYIVRNEDDANPNVSLHDAHNINVVGDVVVFKRGTRAQQLVNMRRGDDRLAVQAIHHHTSATHLSTPTLLALTLRSHTAALRHTDIS
ncbi:hypothetical protein EIP86_007988 [Pleurotus ostreatoroseus]|nr:hypothetical protein EIP86_007988 [Pleurotus ostreatoroseus]